MQTLEIDDKQVTTALQQLSKQTKNLRPAMQGIGSALKGRINLGFRSGTSPEGSAWKPVSRGGQPLRDTGRLQRSITFIADNKGVDVGTNVCYAPVHQFGATIEAGKGPGQSICGMKRKGKPNLVFRVGGKLVFTKKVVIPARPFMPVNDLPKTWQGSVLDVMQKHLGF